jgi:phage host-nuclease inhibitor protein Gam
MIKTTADLDKTFLRLSEAQRSINRIQDRYNAEIESLKKELKAQIDPLLNEATGLETEITQFASKSWNGTSREQEFTFGSVKWSIPKGAVEFLKPVTDVIKNIKKMGFDNLIRVKEEVKKDDLKGLLVAQPALCNKLGAKVVVGDPTPSVVVNDAKVTTYDPADAVYQR